MYFVILTIPLAQYDLFLEKLHPTSRAYELLVNGCFDEDISNAQCERKIQILCNKDEAVLIVTMTALVLGLVVASAKGSYDAQDEAVRHTAAKLLLLDRAMSNYGPETTEAHDLLRRIIASRVSAIWPEDRSKSTTLDAPEAARAAQEIENGIMNLSPRTDVQRRLQSQALQIFSDIIETRWLILGDLGRSVPIPSSW